MAGAAALSEAIAIGGGGASSGSSAAALISSCAPILAPGEEAPGDPGIFAQAVNPAVSASIDTNILISLCDRLFVTVHPSPRIRMPNGNAKRAVYQVGPLYASLNIPLSRAPTTVFLVRETFVKKPAVTWTAGIKCLEERTDNKAPRAEARCDYPETHYTLRKSHMCIITQHTAYVNALFTILTCSTHI